MKNWILVGGLVSLIAAAAWSSITLDPSKVQSFSEGGTVVESNAIAAVTTLGMNFQHNTVETTLSYGNFDGGAFVPGRNAKMTSITIDVNTGVMGLNNGQADIQLTPAQRTAILGIMRDLRNQMEAFVLARGVTVGTQVPWP